MITLDQALNKIVLCSDGAYRILRQITNHQLFYDVPIGGGRWLSMGGTPRREVQKMFENGKVVEKIPCLIS